MSKHPTPWTMGGFGQICDANGERICRVMLATDPETRAVLLHAGEMWQELQNLWARRPNLYDAAAKCHDLAAKIEAEIAAGRKP